MTESESELQPTLNAMQQELEAELVSLGRFVERFRALDAPEAEDLARNTMRAYEAMADVVRMVSELRSDHPGEPEPRRIDRIACRDEVLP